MSAWAKPGVKCICVDDVPRDSRAVRVKRRHTYVIEEVVCHGAAVCLVGVDEGRSYYTDRFRPLITRTQSEDVALFRKLLVTEGADA